MRERERGERVREREREGVREGKTERGWWMGEREKDNIIVQKSMPVCK